MKYKVFYGGAHKITDTDRQMFTRGMFECRRLLQTAKGQPVGISQSTDPDFPVWKIEYGWSCLVFPSYEDAMAYCRGRFKSLDGKEV